QAGRLTLTNVRSTHGLLGAARPDHKVLPGDVYYLAFEIDGLQIDDSGKARYSIAIDVANGQGKTIFKQDPRNHEATNAFGGTRIPAVTRLSIGLDQAPGDYTLKLTVADLTGKGSQTLTQTVQVLPKAFGLVQFALTGDAEGQVPVPPVGAVGQTVHVHLVGVGFSRDPARKQPNVSVELQVLDENGKPTAKPF